LAERDWVIGRHATSASSCYTGYWFPPAIISYVVWLYFRFPLSLRMVEEMLAARDIVVSHGTVRQWALKFGQDCTNEIRRRLPQAGDQHGVVLDVLVQSRRDAKAACAKRTVRSNVCFVSS
jgi:putative transposase